MKIKLSKTQWEKIGQDAGWDKQITKFNLEIHQLLEYANQQTMLKYLETIEKNEYPGNRDSFEAIRMLREFISKLMQFSPKIKHIVELYENDMEVGERRPLPEDIDVGKDAYEKHQKNQKGLDELNKG